MPSVGFDLDMTLVDTRRGIRTALRALSVETGRDIDAEAVVASLGPPVAVALSPWFAPDELPEAVATFRGHMAVVGVVDVESMPGARELIEAVQGAGLDAVVITAKIESLARATLQHAGLSVDLVYGDVWAEAKAAPLVAAGALAFVGDHPADMLAAVAAGVPGFGVTSGASSYDELVAAGATRVVTSLRELTDVLPRIGSGV